MDLDKDIGNALVELRKGKERKFDQTVDLIVNLQMFDVKKSAVNIVISVPHNVKEKKIAGFLESKNANVDSITPDMFKDYKDKGKLKNLIKKYDFFIAQGSLMPKVATTFGRALGPAGKMPSPQLGIVLNADDKTIKNLKDKVNNSVKIRAKEASIKLAIGKQSMEDKDIIENVSTIYKAIEKALPRGRENVKNIELKFSMTKPVKMKVR
jgi:large subunit ribosomal protein L1